jgi:RepB DNA-primase N-terminal domain
MIPLTWDAETTRRSIPWLRLQNAEGRNIYIHPKGEHGLSLIDDISADSVRWMKEEGFQPALIVETSPGNFQAWLKHPRSLPHDVSTAAARTLARQFGGDLGAADWRHFGRLAGFTNHKPNRALENGLFPFVRLIQASGLPYANGEQFVSRIEDQLMQEREERDRLRSLYAEPRAAGLLRTIDSFRANPAYAGDGTRIDLAYAIYAGTRTH